MSSSIYPSSCLLPHLLLVLHIYWVKINSIIFFTLNVPHQTNYSLVTYTTNWKIQAIWNDEEWWMKKMHTKAPHDRNIKIWLTTEEHCLVNLYQSLFPPISFLHMVFTTKCNLPNSSDCLLLQYLPPITPPPSRSPSKNLLYFHDPNCSTYSCCNRMATAPNTTYSKGHCAERRK